MKVFVKTLDQKKYELELELTDTVKVVKGKLHAAHGIAPETQKLIYGGKILSSDEDPISKYNVTEGSFFVVMVTKAKNAPAAAAAATPAPAPAATPAAAPAATPAAAPAATPAPAPAATPAPAPAATPAPAPAATPAATTSASDSPSTGDGSGFVRGAELEQVVSNIMEMGFSDRDQVLLALRAAFNNPERAVEYLMTGIPQHALAQVQPPAPAPAPAPAPGQPPPTAPPTAAPTAAPTAGGQGGGLLPPNMFAPAQGGPGGDDPLRPLREHPQFEQFRTVVQQRPNMLPQLLQHMAQTSPELVQLIAANREAFQQLLVEGAPEGSPFGDAGLGGGVPSGMVPIQITPEEEETIDRLCGLGFDKAVVVQAYFACDKNETLAANLLLEHGADFMQEDDAPGGAPPQ